LKKDIFLALGTNLGDREANLRSAKELLAPKIVVERESAIYVTPPWGYEDQPEFLNQVIKVKTCLRPLALLKVLKRIEKGMGREETFRNGPRLIDLDILFYGQQVIQKKNLCIPHPRMRERAFVLVPLCEIAPDFVHPVLKETVQTLLSRVDTQGVRRL
jgi:2-amino-4-hydroxy-6-hydroxymethyldihydropteridine diphosphokinase